MVVMVEAAERVTQAATVTVAIRVIMVDMAVVDTGMVTTAARATILQVIMIMVDTTIRTVATVVQVDLVVLVALVALANTTPPEVTDIEYPRAGLPFDMSSKSFCPRKCHAVIVPPPPIHQRVYLN